MNLNTVYNTFPDSSEKTATWMAFAMIGRCFAAIALSGTIQMTYEIFPTVVRVRGVAVASAAGMTVSFLSPFIIHSVSANFKNKQNRGPSINDVIHKRFLTPPLPSFICHINNKINKTFCFISALGHLPLPSGHYFWMVPSSIYFMGQNCNILNS